MFFVILLNLLNISLLVLQWIYNAFLKVKLEEDDNIIDFNNPVSVPNPSGMRLAKHRSN